LLFSFVRVLQIAAAHESFLAHQERYVKWSMAYELPEVYKYFDALEEALKGVAVDDVQFTNGLRKTDLRDLCKNSLNQKEVGKGLLHIAKRIQKHLPHNEGLARQVWLAVEAYIRTRFKKFQSLVSQCYQNEKLQLTWQDLTQLLQAANHDSHFDEVSNASDLDV
jgi:hypothetical protein